MEKLNQLGLIAYLVQRLGPKNKLGRKAVQKYIHIATELGKVPTGYQFSFYTYGPYSRELATDLELAESINGIKSSQDAVSGAYDIKTGDTSGMLIDCSKNFLDEQRDRLDLVFETFGGFSARTLELYSTIIFLKSEEPSTAGSKADLMKRVRELKPKYSVAEFDNAFDTLNKVEPNFR